MNIAIMLTLVGSFAILLTVHLSLAIGLACRKPRWRGLVALLLAPLAPYWGHGARMRVRTTLWLAALCIYLLSLFAAMAETG